MRETTYDGSQNSIAPGYPSSRVVTCVRRTKRGVIPMGAVATGGIPGRSPAPAPRPRFLLAPLVGMTFRRRPVTHLQGRRLADEGSREAVRRGSPSRDPSSASLLGMTPPLRSAETRWNPYSGASRVPHELVLGLRNGRDHSRRRAPEDGRVEFTSWASVFWVPVVPLRTYSAIYRGERPAAGESHRFAEVQRVPHDWGRIARTFVAGWLVAVAAVAPAVVMIAVTAGRAATDAERALLVASAAWPAAVVLWCAHRRRRRLRGL